MPSRRSKKKTGPRGLALAIGLNKPSRKYYGNQFDPLKGAEIDARKMSKLARKRGFVCRRLTGRQATWRRLMTELDNASASLESGDIFLLSYSGHGSTIEPDWIENNFDPLPPSVAPGETIQTWVLWDKELLDKELRKKWTKFKPGVRILVLLDSCHSFSAVLPPLPPALRKRERIKERVRLVRILPELLQRPVLDREKLDYKKRLEDAMPLEQARNSTQARVLVLAACQDKEMAVDDSSGGLFTTELLTALNSTKSPPQDYTGLVKQVQAAFLLMRDVPQQPGMLLYPEENNFEAERPFTIEASG